MKDVPRWSAGFDGIGTYVDTGHARCSVSNPYVAEQLVEAANQIVRRANLRWWERLPAWLVS